MHKPLLSIVLPVYNGERFLQKALDSILNQSYINFELIIVDDHSNDNTPNIILEYAKKDNRIKTIRHRENRYLPQALNTGFSNAKGELFTWTSDDNIYLLNALEGLVDTLVLNKDIDVVYGEQRIIDERGRIINKRDAIAQVNGPECIPILSCVGGYFMFRRKVYYDVGGYDLNWFLVEDWQFWLKAYNAGFVFSKINDCNYLYRDSDQSLTATRANEVQSECLKLSLDNLNQNKEKYPVEIVSRAYLKCVGFAFRLNDLKAGIECFQMAKNANRNARSLLNNEMVEWLEGKYV